MEFFATCPTGFEHLLARELVRLGIRRVRPLQGQVSFDDELRAAYQACLWSRLASRVVAVVGRGPAANADELYASVADVAWEEHLPARTTFAIRASGTNAQLRTSQFVALRAKDAIVDRMQAKTGVRPAVDTHRPRTTCTVRVSRDRVAIGIDLAGTPLFERPYLRRGTRRGLRPDYAAALLELVAWADLCEDANDELTFVDLSPQVGAIACEAAMTAALRAPGLGRHGWGFEGWSAHEPDTWASVVADAQARSLGRAPLAMCMFRSAQGGTGMRAALRAAGVEASLEALDDEELCGLTHPSLAALDLSDLLPHQLAQESATLSAFARVMQAISPARTVVAARDELAEAFLRCEPHHKLATRLGQDPLYLSAFDEVAHGQDALPTVVAGSAQSLPVLVAASDQFAARLRKVAKERAKWAHREDVSCYRVYDADLPDYAVAIDLFQGTDPATGMPDGRRWLVVAEYAPPKSVNALLAQSRLVDVLAIAPAVLGVDPRNTFVRVRRQAKGGSQYAQEAKPGGLETKARRSNGTPLPAGAHLIDEGGLTFEVNFSTRLDCGIFLDHRDTRALVREMAKETKGSKRFLNLFAYTGTATCYAADGGMRHTTTVDLSRPSLDWARRNMERNGFKGREHEFVQADVVSWVSEQRHTPNRWDLVFCDVPTFSNSSRMGKRSFDVQRDHTELLIGVSRLLTRNGTCVFSCNLRSFKLDEQGLARAGVAATDITATTIPHDFARNPRIHHTYLITRVPAKQ